MSQTIYFGTYTKKNPKEFTRHILEEHIEPSELCRLQLTYIAFSEKATSTASELKREKEESQALQLIFSRSINVVEEGAHFIRLCR